MGISVGVTVSDMREPVPCVVNVSVGVLLAVAVDVGVRVCSDVSMTSTNPNGDWVINGVIGA